jgi:hypothetical protein
MRVPRVRFTMLRMMVAVAIPAILMGGWKMKRERQLRLGQVAFHANLEGDFQRLLKFIEPRVAELRAKGVEGPFGAQENYRAMLDHSSRMRRKWERAAARPWEPVDPDPPQPLEVGLHPVVQKNP